MSGPTADALYEVYALRYATHAGAQRGELSGRGPA